MNFFRKASIKRKQTLIMMTITTVALLLACSGFTVYDVLTFRSSMVRNLSTLAEIIGNNTVSALDFNDQKAAEETLSALKAQPHIVAAYVYATDGTVFASYDRDTSGHSFVPSRESSTPEHSFRKGNLTLSRPIASKGDTVGAVYLVSDIGDLYSRLGQYALIIAAVLLLTTIVAFVMSNRLQRFISEPILRLAVAARTVAQDKDYAIRVEKENPDEMGNLIDGFNEMLEQIQRQNLEVREVKKVLEERVGERTSELASANAALHQENLERKQAESAVRRTEEIYRRAISSANAVPYAYDYVTKSYQFMDEGIKQLIGYPASEVTPALWNKLIQESVMGGDSAGMEKSEAGRRVIKGEIRSWLCDMRVITRDGKLRWISDVSVHAFDDAGNFASSIGILQDITDRKQAEISARTFSKLGQELFSATTVDAAARIIARVAEELFGCDAFGLYLYFPETKEIQSVLESDILDGQRTYITSAGREKPGENIQRVLKNGPELFLRDGVHMDPNSRPFGDMKRSSACIMRVPLRVMGKATGVLAVHSYTPDVYTAKDLHFLQTLADYCSGAFERITGEEKLRALHKQLVDSSRLAGMAEVATSVLHNVGNVLNSINVGATLMEERFKKSRVVHLHSLAKLLDEHAHDRAAFLTVDPRGQKIPEFISQLSQKLAEEQAGTLEEFISLRKNIEHINEIIAMQQSYARVAGVFENIGAGDLLEDALRMNADSLARHEVKVVREYGNISPICTDKHKVLQILVNLIRNANFACDESKRPDKQVTLQVTNGDGRARIAVVDNGVGIPKENLIRIFNHGFTTRKDGHGFGLHSGALAAKELGGSLTVQSDGVGKGATFILELPCAPPADRHIVAVPASQNN